MTKRLHDKIEKNNTADVVTNPSILQQIWYYIGLLHYDEEAELGSFSRLQKRRDVEEQTETEGKT